MWKVVTSSNLNPPLKLFFYSPILTNNNLLLKIYCEKYYGSIFQLGFFIFYIVFLPFISFSSTFHFFFFFFFLFLVFLLHTSVQPPFFYSPQEHSSISHLLHMRERERERERLGPPLPLVVLPTIRLGQIRLSFFFLFSFFSYLLVLIQLYFKNWILFCVLCFVFGLCEKLRE